MVPADRQSNSQTPNSQFPVASSQPQPPPGHVAPSASDRQTNIPRRLSLVYYSPLLVPFERHPVTRGIEFRYILQLACDELESRFNYSLHILARGRHVLLFRSIL